MQCTYYQPQVTVDTLICAFGVSEVKGHMQNPVGGRVEEDRQVQRDVRDTGAEQQR